MTMDKSLKGKTGLRGHRSVLTRTERLAKLAQLGRWKEGNTLFGLPKVRVEKARVRVKPKKEVEKAPVAAAGAAPAEGAAEKAAGKAGAKVAAPVKGAEAGVPAAAGTHRVPSAKRPAGEARK